MIKKKYKISDFIICLVLGAFLGGISKYLDTIAVDENWWTYILHFFAALFTRMGIWILIATLIASYSKTTKRAAVNTFAFFIGMLITYYGYSAYLFGFFPTSYFLLWGSISLLSPILAIIVWHAKNNKQMAVFLPALPMGLMLSLSLGIGLSYIYINHFEELIMYVLLCVVFFKNPKQLALLVALSMLVAIFVSQVTPFHF